MLRRQKTVSTLLHQTFYNPHIYLYGNSAGNGLRLIDSVEWIIGGQAINS